MSSVQTRANIFSLFRRGPQRLPMDIMVTLWPSFPHFPVFANDERLSGIRLNSAMIGVSELDREFGMLPKSLPVPLYFDIKGRQLRITEVHDNPDYLDITLNHPISVVTPTTVLFKAGADNALLREVREDGKRLLFAGGPHYKVIPGESLHIRHPSLRVRGEQFTDAEKLKIEKVKKAGFTRYFLSYVENQRDVDEFLELIGPHEEVLLKIENKRGLEYVAKEFKKRDNLRLVAAQGDLYVEIARPHQILPAMKLIVGKDPRALVGSRMMLSVVHEPVPSCADFEQLAWLYDIGYRSFMLCDEMCLKEPLLTSATNAICAFRDDYAA